ncbi:MAG: glycosyl hydrolase, partial [Prevotella sp.]|nr:glycosyl hydrolase [Prevotella sp.]
MNGNITKDGIYKDLTWMKRSGIGGFHVFDAGLSTPQVVEKRLPYMTPEWKDAFHYAIHLADSLRLEATIASAPGWSETGGPWVKDEDGMKKLVWRQTEVKGTGKALKVKLPGGFDITGPYQDYCYVNQSVATVFLQKKFYRDVAVLAMRIPDNDKSMMELNPTITTSGGTVTADQLGNDSISDYS